MISRQPYAAQPEVQVAGNGFNGIVYSAQVNGAMEGIGYVMCFRGIGKETMQPMDDYKLILLYGNSPKDFSSKKGSIIGNFQGMDIKTDAATKYLLNISADASINKGENNLENNLEYITSKAQSKTGQDNKQYLNRGPIDERTKAFLKTNTVEAQKARAALSPSKISKIRYNGIESKLQAQQNNERTRQMQYSPITSNVLQSRQNIEKLLNPYSAYSKDNSRQYAQSLQKTRSNQQPAKIYSRLKTEAYSDQKPKQYLPSRQKSKAANNAKPGSKEYSSLKRPSYATARAKEYSTLKRPSYSRANASQKYGANQKIKHIKPTQYNSWLTGGMHPGKEYAKNALGRLKPYNYLGQKGLDPRLFTKQDSGYPAGKAYKPREFKHSRYKAQAQKPLTLPSAQKALPQAPLGYRINMPQKEKALLNQGISMN